MCRGFSFKVSVRVCVSAGVCVSVCKCVYVCCMPLSLCLFRMCIPILCSVCVCACTQLMFMWGNLGLAAEEKREVPVPSLPPGQVGVVSVAFQAPLTEGTYTSHWRLAHCGCQFGPRVWCSIVVDSGDGRRPPGHQSERPASLHPVTQTVDLSVHVGRRQLVSCVDVCGLHPDAVLTCRCCSASQKAEVKQAEECSGDGGGDPDLHQEDYYFPSVELLTAQVLRQKHSAGGRLVEVCAHSPLCPSGPAVLRAAGHQYCPRAGKGSQQHSCG